MKTILRIRCAQGIIAAGMLALLTGCSSTHIQSRRNPETMGAAPFRNVMVVGMDGRPLVRDPFEDDVVRSLRAHGIDGIPSHTKYSLAEMKGKPEQVHQLLAATSVDSVLFIRMTDRGTFVDGPLPGLGSVDMGAVDEAAYNSFTSVGPDINTEIRLGARFYRASDGAAIWSGLLDTVLKEDYDSIVVLRNVAQTIVDRLAKDKVIP